MAIIQLSIRLKGRCYIWQVMKQTLLGKILAVKKLTFINKFKNSSILFAKVFKKAQVVFSAISLPEKDF